MHDFSVQSRDLGAEEGTRTPTPLRVHGPEPCASANSATSARVETSETLNSLFRKQPYCTGGLARLAIALRCSPFTLRQNKSCTVSEKRMANSGSSACCFGHFARAMSAILLQLVMQGLQADAEDFGRARLIIIGGFQRLQNEQTLGLTHRGADAEPHRVGFLHRRARNHLSETRWQVLGLDQRTFAYDHGALQRVAQFANVPWPCVCRERIHHRFG